MIIAGLDVLSVERAWDHLFDDQRQSKEVVTTPTEESAPARTQRRRRFSLIWPRQGVEGADVLIDLKEALRPVLAEGLIVLLAVVLLLAQCLLVMLTC